jgi:hypothetical protein
MARPGLEGDGAYCNLKASSRQEKPRKCKQKPLDLVGFLWPNLDFSKGYGGKNKKIKPHTNSPLRLRIRVSDARRCNRPPSPQPRAFGRPAVEEGAASSKFQASFCDTLAETGNDPDAAFVSGKNSGQFRNPQDNVDFSAIAAFRQDVRRSARRSPP